MNRLGSAHELEALVENVLDGMLDGLVKEERKCRNSGQTQLLPKSQQSRSVATLVVSRLTPIGPYARSLTFLLLLSATLEYRTML